LALFQRRVLLFFETLRALAYAPYGGADIGEVHSTASRIPDGDETAWYAEGARSPTDNADADRSAPKPPVSARESYLRASTTTGSARSTCASIRRMTPKFAK